MCSGVAAWDVLDVRVSPRQLPDVHNGRIMRP